MTMTVRVRGGGGTSKGTLHIKVVDLDENPPPDPNADDRNDEFTRPSVPSNAEVTSASWGVWRPWWREYWVWHSGDEDDDSCQHQSEFCSDICAECGDLFSGISV